MTMIFLNGSSLDTRDDLYGEVRRQMELGDCFGNNADALYDVLTSLSRETHIVLTNTDAARRNIGPYFGVIEKVLTDAANVTPALSVSFMPGSVE